MDRTAHIVVVEDRDSLRRMLCQALGGEGYRVSPAADLAAARQVLAARDFDLVLTDLMLPDGSGLDVVSLSRQLRELTPVVVMTGFGTIPKAVEAMQLGASDFLEKPVELDDLFDLTERLLADSASEPSSEGEARAAVAPALEAAGAPPIVGSHPRLMAALRLLRKVAPTDSTVLLTGESGTGKGLFAQALHALSRRSAGPFVAVNCAAIPVTLMENELFGHEKGAFTGASRRQVGRFELAQGGTLFLDEIGELEPGVQGKVLRALEERVFERVGGGRPIQADVRVIAATNRDLAAMSRDGSFRQDLYYRLDVFPIELPALRERASDVPALAEHLVGRIAERQGLPRPVVGPEVLDLLVGQPWPGNVRQLANLLERGVILSDGEKLAAGDLEPFLDRESTTATAETTSDSEVETLKSALLATEGDKRRAAELLGISYRTLQRRIQQHDLEGFPKYRR